MGRPISWKDVGFRGGSAANMAVAQRGFNNLGKAAKDFQDKIAKDAAYEDTLQQRAIENERADTSLRLLQNADTRAQGEVTRALTSEQAIKDALLGTAKSAAIDSKVNNAYEELTKRFKGNYGTGLETDEYTRELDKLNAQAINAHKQGNIFGTVYDSHAYGQRVLEEALKNGATPSEAKAAGVHAEKMYEQRLSNEDAARKAQLLGTINASETANVKAIMDSVSTVTSKTGTTSGGKGSSKSGPGSNKAFWTTPAAMNMDATIATLKKNGVDDSWLNTDGELKDAGKLSEVLRSAYTTDPKTGKVVYFSPKLQSDLLTRAIGSNTFAGNQVVTDRLVKLIEEAKKDPLLLQSISSGHDGSKGGRTSSVSVKSKQMSQAQSDAIASLRTQARNARAAIEREYALPTASSEFSKYFGGGQKTVEPAVVNGSKTNKEGKVYKTAGNDLLVETVKKTKPKVDSRGGTQTTNSTEGTNDADILSRAFEQSDAQAVENEKDGFGGEQLTALEKAVALRAEQQKQRQLDTRNDREILRDRLKTQVNPTGSGGQDPFNLKDARAQLSWLSDTLGLNDKGINIDIDPRNLQSGLFTQQPTSPRRNKMLQTPQLTPLQLSEIAKQPPEELERTYNKLGELDKLLLAQYLQTHRKKQ